MIRRSAPTPYIIISAFSLTYEQNKNCDPACSALSKTAKMAANSHDVCSRDELDHFPVKPVADVEPLGRRGPQGYIQVVPDNAVSQLRSRDLSSQGFNLMVICIFAQTNL
jgi:hypothetical protein